MTFSDMKKAKQILLDNGYTTAADIVPALTDTDLQAILAGDFSALDQRKPQAQTERRKDQQTKHQGARDRQTSANDMQTTPATGQQDHHGERSTGSMERGTDGDIITDSGGTIETIPSDSLPVSIASDIENMLLDYAHHYKLDLDKCSNLQWRSAMLAIGMHFKKNGLLRDTEYIKTHGTNRIDPNKVAQLLPIWEHFTALYKHVPLAVDFVAFCGVSREWFYDSGGKGLTSGQIDIVQKMRAIEEASLSAALVDHRENPTGRIFYTKARLGWQESSTVVHVSASPAITSADLPALPSKS